MRWTMPCVAIVLSTMPSAIIAKGRAAPAAPIGNLGDWFPVSSYPVEAKRNGEQGRVSVELTIDKTGKPTACQLIASSGSASLDAGTCDLALANARFIPAKDVSGRPIASKFALPALRWQLDDDYLHLDLTAGPISTTVSNVEVMVDERGKVVSCRSLASTSGGKTGCEKLPPGLVMIRPPFLNGKPTAGKVTVTTTMRIEPK